ncbi:MAG: hypothetical protein EOP49_16460, partial [Sphingobacteriales bacterium]
MKNILLLLTALLCYAAALAQPSDSAATTSQWTIFQAKYQHIKEQYFLSKENISAFKISNQYSDRDSVYHNELASLRAAKLKWKTAYDQARDERGLQRSIRNRVVDSLEIYYGKQSYYKYKVRSQWFRGGGIVLISAGSAMVAGGAIAFFIKPKRPVFRKRQ